MEKEKNILSLLDFEEFKVDIDATKISKSKFDFIRNEVREKIDIDSIYFSGEYASVYFKSITGFDNDNLIEICKLHKSIWNQHKVPLLYVSTPTEIRIYNCFETPINPEENLNRIDKIEIKRYSVNDTIEHLSNLVNLLNRAAVDSGELWKKEEIINKFNVKNRVDNVLVENLKNSKINLRDKGISETIIHNILIRSLFVLYLEDIGATDAKYYQQFKTGANSYFDLLSDSKATYFFYSHLENKFNGNLFPVTQEELEKIGNSELKIIASCFWGNDVKSGQQSIWRKFDFSFIPIELLSEIYEIFLNKTDKQRSDSGEYYTPYSLVDLVLNESLPWADDKNTEYNLKILDLACGSGIFLVESFRRLVDRWIWANKRNPNFKELEKILTNSIFAYEVNSEAIKVASFSLYLTLISYLDPKNIWQEDNIRFPYLIFDPKNESQNKQGNNLFLQSSLSNERPFKFDLVVGNPPFKSAKTGSIEPESSAYCKAKGYAQEMVLPFLDRASWFCNDTGKVAIISTSKILFNKSGGYQKFREFLFQENYVDTVINFSALRKAKKGQGKSIFAHAVGPSCVLFYQKQIPAKKSNTITYVCPKPTERDTFSDSLILDALDFSYIPRLEAEKKDSIIWKTAMWGAENDFNLIKSLSRINSLNYYLIEKNGWHKGGGFKLLTPTKDSTYINNQISNLPLIEAKHIERYYTKSDVLQYDLKCTLTDENKLFYYGYYGVTNINEIPTIDVFRALGNLTSYTAPHLLIKEGQSDKRFTSSYLDYDCSFKHTITGVSFDKTNLSGPDLEIRKNILKALSAVLNSKIASYFYFLTSVSWGVERERVTAKDMLELPAIPFEINQTYVNLLAKKLDEISSELSEDFRDELKIERIEAEIEKIICEALSITQREQYLIEDVLNYSLDLFQEGENSIAIKPVDQYNTELHNYLEILCEDINEHLQFNNDSVWASIWEMPVSNPMRLVAIHFTKERSKGDIYTFPHSSDLNSIIRSIDKYSYEKHSASVYFRKVVRYYEGDIVYIIKPNQKRFWSRSQAMQDSKTILLEIANMSEE